MSERLTHVRDIDACEFVHTMNDRVNENSNAKNGTDGKIA